jgi:hypothetical protein
MSDDLIEAEAAAIVARIRRDLEVDREAAAIVARIRRDLGLDERREVHASRTGEMPTDPQGPAALFHAWLLWHAGPGPRRP